MTTRILSLVFALARPIRLLAINSCLPGLVSCTLALTFLIGGKASAQNSTNCALVMTCPSNIVVTSCFNVQEFYSPTAFNICCGVYSTVTCTPPSGSIFAVGTTTTVNCTATDCAQNTNFCSFTVTVIPGNCATNYLQVQCPTNLVVASCTNIQVFYAPIVTDTACSNWTVVLSPPSGSYFAPNTTTLVDCFVGDYCGLTNDCSFNVTVVQPIVSYTNVLFPGYNFVANPLNNPSGNTANILFTNPAGAHDFDMLEVPNCGSNSTAYTIDSSFPTGYADGSDSFGVTPPTVPPGQGVIYVNNTGVPETVVFTGYEDCSPQPSPLCPCGMLSLVGPIYPGPGTYQNITGQPPQPGSEVIIFNGSGFNTNTYNGSTWSPNTPVLNIGQAAYILVPCPTNCITLVCPTNIVLATCSNCAQAFYAATATNLCCFSHVVLQYSLPSGTCFPLGTNTVQVTAYDPDCASTPPVSCSFTVTVVPGTNCSTNQGCCGPDVGPQSIQWLQLPTNTTPLLHDPLGTNGALTWIIASLPGYGNVLITQDTPTNVNAICTNADFGRVHSSGSFDNVQNANGTFRFTQNVPGLYGPYSWGVIPGQLALAYARQYITNGMAAPLPVYHVHFYFLSGPPNPCSLVYSSIGLAQYTTNTLSQPLTFRTEYDLLYETTNYPLGPSAETELDGVYDTALEGDVTGTVVSSAYGITGGDDYNTGWAVFQPTNVVTLATLPSGSGTDIFSNPYPPTTNLYPCLSVTVDSQEIGDIFSLTVGYLCCTNCPTNCLLVQCPEGKTVPCGAAWTFDAPVATSCCTNLFVTSNGATNILVIPTGTVTNGTCPQFITQSWLIEDACGDTDTCSQIVMVTGCCTNCFQVLCPTNKSVSEGSAWTFDSPVVIDCCSNLLQTTTGVTNVLIIPTGTVTNGSCPQYTVTQSWFIEDGCSNSASCSQTVTVLCGTNCCQNCTAPYPESYTVTILPVTNWVVNSLCQGTNSTLGNILPDGNGALNGLLVYIWDPVSQSYLTDFSDSITSTYANGWINGGSEPVPPGTGIEIIDTSGVVYTITISGCQPDCPPPCMPGDQWTLVGGTGTNAVLSWTNLFSCPPVCGTQIQIINPTNQVITTYTYMGGSWTPPLPVPLLAVGQAAQVEVNTNLGMVVSCPPSMTVQCGTDWTFGTPVAATCCPILLANGTPAATNVLIIPTGTVTNGACPQLTITQNWLIVDGCGDSNTCSQTVTVLGCCNTNCLQVACATNKIVACGDTWSFDPPNATTCCSNLTFTLLSSNLVSSTPCQTVYQGVWQVSDSCTNSAVCTQLVTVVNSGAPILMAGIVLDYATLTNAGITFAGGNFNFVNNGGGVQFDVDDVYGGLGDSIGFDGFISGGPFAIGTITISGPVQTAPVTGTGILHISDGTYQLTGTVQWIDITTIGTSGVLNLNGVVNLTGITYPGSSSDLQDLTASGTASVDLTFQFVPGKTLTQLVATGGSTDFSGTIEGSPVLVTPPLITCSTNKTVPCGAKWSFDPPVPYIGCCTNWSIVVLSTMTNSLSSSCSTNYTRTWQVSDCCSNTAICSQTVTVQGCCQTNCLQVLCPTNKTVQNCAAWSFDPPIATTCCSNLFNAGTAAATSVLIMPISTVTNGSCPEYTVTQTWLIEDGCSNSAECSQTVTVLCCTNCCGTNAGPRNIEWLQMPGTNYPPLSPDPSGLNTGGTWIITNLPCYGRVLVTQTFPDNSPDETYWFLNTNCVGVPRAYGSFQDVQGGYGPYSWGSYGSVLDFYNGHSGSDIKYNVNFYFLDGAPNPCTLYLGVIGLASNTTVTVSQPVVFRAEYDLAANSPNGNGNASANTTLGGVYGPLVPGTVGTVVGSAWGMNAVGDRSNTGWAVLQPSSPVPLFTLPSGSGTDINGNSYPPTTNQYPCLTLAVDQEGYDGIGFTVGYVCCPTNCLQVQCATNKTVPCGSTWNFDPPVVTTCCKNLIQTPTGLTNVLIIPTSTVTNGVCPQFITQSWLIQDDCGDSAACDQTVTVLCCTNPCLQVFCPSNMTVVTCSNCVPLGFFATAIDQCCSNVQIHYLLGTTLIGTNYCFPLGVSTVQVTATDGCNNTASCDFTVTVIQGTNCTGCLQVQCPTNKTVQSCKAWSFDPPIASTCCTNPIHLGSTGVTNILIMPISTVTNGVCPQYTVTQTWLIEDGCSNSSMCSQTVTVVCCTNPCLQVQCPTNKTVQNCAAWSFDSPIATTCCSNLFNVGTAAATNVMIMPISTVTNGSCPEYTVTQTWLIEDACSNSSVCSQTVTVLCCTNCCGTNAGPRNIEWLQAPAPNSMPLYADPLGLNTNGTWIITNLPCYGRVLVTQTFPDNNSPDITYWFLNPNLQGVPGAYGSFQDVQAGYGPYLWGTYGSLLDFYNGHSGSDIKYNVNFYFLDGAPNPCTLYLGVVGLASNTTVTVSQSVIFRAEYDLAANAPGGNGNASANTTLGGVYGPSVAGTSGTVVGSAWGMNRVGDPSNTGWAVLQPSSPVPLIALPPGSGTDINGNSYPPTTNQYPCLTLAVDQEGYDGIAFTVGYVCCPTNCLQVQCATNKTVPCGSTWHFDPPVATTCCTNLLITPTSRVTNGICPQNITQNWLIRDGCGNSTVCSQTVTVLCCTNPCFQIVTNGLTGNLFVADWNSGNIYEFTPSGTRSTFATGLSYPDGLAFDTAGNLFVACQGSGGSIIEIAPNGSQSVFATGLTTPNQLAFDAAGNLYVGVGGSPYTIYEYTPLGVRSTFATGYEGNGLAFNTAGDLFAASFHNDNISEFTPSAVQSLFATGLNGPEYLAFDSAGNLFVGDWLDSRIYKFTSLGVQSTFATGVTYPWGLAFDGAGNLFEADYGTGDINKFAPNGSRTTFATGLSPTALAFQPAVSGLTNIVITSCTNIPVYYSLSVTDICCTNWSVTFNPASGSLFAPGTTTTVTALATDSCGNSNSWSFTVTVIQATNCAGCLQVQCPTNKTVRSCAAWNFDPPIATTCCTNLIKTGRTTFTNILILPVSTVTNGSCPQYTVTQTWFIEDGCNDTNFCSQTVTVICCTNCLSLQCPGDFIVPACTNCATVNFSATATDLCCSNVQISYFLGTAQIGTNYCFPLGHSTVTVLASDACSNTASCSFTVSVVPCNDTNCIDLICPANITNTVCGSNCAPVKFAASGVDYCCTNLVINYHLNGTLISTNYCFPPGLSSVSVTATDACGNVASCGFNVTIIVANPLAFVSAPTNVVICEGTTLSGAVIVDSDEWDNSDAGFGLEGYANGAAYVTNCANYLTGNGAHGRNILICSHDFSLNQGDMLAALTAASYTVTHSVPPLPASLTGYNAVYVSGDPLTAAELAELQNFVCSGGGLYIAAGTGGPGGAVGEAAQWNALLNGFGLNLASVYDLLTGVLTTPSPLQTNSCPVMNNVSAIYNNNGNDVNTIVGYPQAQVIANYGSEGLIGISSCASSGGNCGLMPNLSGQVTTSGGTFTQSIPPGTVICTNTSVTLTISNACGSTNITIPVILINCASNCLSVTCPTNLTFVTCSNCVPVHFAATATDLCCSNVQISYFFGGSLISTNYCFPLGTNLVQVVATDACSNIADCGFSVTVLRGTNCTNCLQVQCPTNKNVQSCVAWNFDPPIASTCCTNPIHLGSTGITNILIMPISTITNGGCPQYTVTQTWLIEDGCSNSAMCSQTVTVICCTNPCFHVQCPTNKTVKCGTSWMFNPPIATTCCTNLIRLGTAGVTNLLIVATSTVTNGACPLVNITRTWLIMDGCSNSATCSQTVTVTGCCTNCLSLTCPTNMIVTTCSNCVAVKYSAQVTDCCSNQLIVSYNPPSGHCFPPGTNFVQVTASDGCGNFATCGFTVTVIEQNCPPIIFLCPTNFIFCTGTNGCTTMPDEVHASSPIFYALYNTGVGPGFAPYPLSAGTLGDPHWNLVSVPAPFASSPLEFGTNTQLQANAAPGWVGADNLSAWIAPANDAANDGPEGNYDYQTTFVLPAESGVTILGQLAADDSVMDVLLNGVSTGLAMSNSFNAGDWSPFTITGPGLAGTNTIDIIVQNNPLIESHPPADNRDTPTGLLVEFNSLTTTTTLPFIIPAAVQATNCDGTPASGWQSIPPGTRICSNTNIIFTFTNLCGDASSRTSSITLETCCVPPPRGMVLWLTLDETVGDTCLNSAGYNNGVRYDGGVPATPANGPAHTLSQYVDNSLCFDGIDDEVEVPNYPAIDLGTVNFTFDAWVRWNGGDGIEDLVDHRVSNPSYTGYVWYLSNGKPALDLDHGSVISFVSSNSMPTNVWTHLAVTVQRGFPNTTVMFYVNGAVHEVTNQTGLSGSLSNSATLWIGNTPLPGGGQFYGCMDELEIFDRALFAGEIAGIYDAGRTGKCRPTCAVPASSAICFDDNTVVVPVQVCNSGSSPMTLTVSFGGLTAAQAGGPPAINGPTIFTGYPATITLPANTCTNFTVTITRPPGLTPAIVAYYQMVIHDPSGQQFSSIGRLTDLISIWCNVIVTQATNQVHWQQITNLVFSVNNPAGSAINLSSEVLVLDGNMVPETNVVSLNTLPPGTAVTNPVALGAYASQQLAVSVNYLDAQPWKPFSVVLLLNIGENGALIPVASTSFAQIMPPNVGPLLTTGTTNGQVVVTWDMVNTGWTLRSKTDLNGTNWIPVNLPAMPMPDGSQGVALPLTNRAQFFQLFGPNSP